MKEDNKLLEMIIEMLLRKDSAERWQNIMQRL